MSSWIANLTNPITLSTFALALALAFLFVFISRTKLKWYQWLPPLALSLAVTVALGHDLIPQRASSTDITPGNTSADASPASQEQVAMTATAPALIEGCSWKPAWGSGHDTSRPYNLSFKVRNVGRAAILNLTVEFDAYDITDINKPIPIGHAAEDLGLDQRIDVGETQRVEKRVDFNFIEPSDGLSKIYCKAVAVSLPGGVVWKYE
jgi:hypothetical protein